MKSAWNKEYIDGLTSVPYLINFTSDDDGLYLKCDFLNIKKTIHFKSYFSLRTIDEGNAFKILEEHDFDGISWLFSTEESDFIKWFDEQSCEIHKNEFKHYLFVSQHQILEILSDIYPIIL